MKYEPNGLPLTDRERELLTITMEECAEVIQACSKLLRFGKENRPDDGRSNSQALAAELGDVECMILKLVDAKLVNYDDITRSAQRKHTRLDFYMQSDPDGDQTSG